jgi:hypothetical protein
VVERVRHPHAEVVTVDAATAATHRWDKQRAQSRGRASVGERTAGSSSSFRGARVVERVRRPHTEVVAVDTATATTHRWTVGARGRGFGSAWGNARHFVVLVVFRCGC